MATNRSVKFQTAATVAEQIIRDSILEGEYEPGYELREVALATELGLSRTPIREALLRLQASGLVEMARGRSAHVRKRTLPELMDTYELRAEVEAYCARRAAEHITDAEVAELWESCARFHDHVGDPDTKALVHENLTFHDAIHRASHNLRAPEIIKTLLELPMLYSAYAWSSEERRQVSEQHHREIAAALENRDGKKAEDIMREHIIEAGRVAVAAAKAAASPGATLGSG